MDNQHSILPVGLDDCLLGLEEKLADHLRSLDLVEELDSIDAQWRKPVAELELGEDLLQVLANPDKYAVWLKSESVYRWSEQESAEMALD
ncbi:hypothetical protein HG530_004813 [Fusarium avenaceum]|nr:hypothetical protein HG530_004813 [Fusarium avenaceum]